MISRTLATRKSKTAVVPAIILGVAFAFTPLSDASARGGRDVACRDHSSFSSLQLNSGTQEPTKIASELPVRVPIIPQDDPLPHPNGKLLSSVLETDVKAPVSFVWETLTDFSGYPQIFPRIESCKVTKRQGNYVYTESYLKPQMFLRNLRQKIVNDLNGKPYVLRWGMLEGNFQNSQGVWELSPTDNGKSCHVKYTLESTAEPVPRAIAGITIKFVQKDIVKTFKRGTEKLYQTRQAQAGGSVAVGR